MPTYQYRRTLVEAVQLSSFNTNHTVTIPRWVLDKIVDGTVQDKDDSDWLVKKPDGSIAVYSNDDFNKEFESTPTVMDR